MKNDNSLQVNENLAGTCRTSSVKELNLENSYHITSYHWYIVSFGSNSDIVGQYIGGIILNEIFLWIWISDYHLYKIKFKSVT